MLSRYDSLQGWVRILIDFLAYQVTDHREAFRLISQCTLLLRRCPDLNAAFEGQLELLDQTPQTGHPAVLREKSGFLKQTFSCFTSQAARRGICHGEFHRCAQTVVIGSTLCKVSEEIYGAVIRSFDVDSSERSPSDGLTMQQPGADLGSIIHVCCANRARQVDSSYSHATTLPADAQPGLRSV